MKRTWVGTVLAAAIACGFPSLSRAAKPEIAGQVTGMSELPDHVQDAVTHEARSTNNEIGELRLQPRNFFSADLNKDGHGEVVTFDRAGNVVERHAY